MQAEFDRGEIAILIEILNLKGVRYLIGEGASLSAAEEQIEPVSLIRRLAACHYPLVEDATIGLFILHPELAPAVVEALHSSEQEIAENLAVHTLATLYLQQWWLFRLACALGRLSSFPEEPFAMLWEERHLPPPAQGYGLDGLLALQEYEQQRYRLPLNFRDGWQNQINHLLIQEEAHQRELSADLIQTLRRISMAYMVQSMKKERAA